MRALVLAGGGAKGAYEVGALGYLVESKKVDFFDAVFGTSVGALNGVGICHYDYLAPAVGLLRSYWFDEIKTSADIYKYHWPKFIAGLFHMSMTDTQPLRTLLHKLINFEAVNKSSVDLYINAVDLLTGKSWLFSKTDPDFLELILASSSFPVFFPPVAYGDLLLTDGGIRDIAMLSQAIRAGADEIYLIHTEGTLELEEPKNALSVALNIINIMSNEILLNDISRCHLVNEVVDTFGRFKKYRPIKLHVLGPSESLGDSLDFDIKLTKDRMSLGYEDAKRTWRK